MPIEAQIKDGCLRITLRVTSLTGEILIFDSLAELKDPPEPVECIELDFRRVDYINSMGVSELINLYRHYKELSIGPFRMRLIQVSPRVNAILELVELHNIATIELQS